MQPDHYATKEGECWCAPGYCPADGDDRPYLMGSAGPETFTTDPETAYRWGYGNGRADGYNRGHDVATARAESRRRRGLPIDEPGTTAFDAEGDDDD